MLRRSLLGMCGAGLFLAGIGFTEGASRATAAEVRDDFDVVIAGGTTAAFAAAVASAESGAKTCLIEPTDWIGGQLTASAVPAVDEAWHTIVDHKTKKPLLNVAKAARDRANMTPNFRAMLDGTGNPGRGWVSNYCFEPKDFLARHLLPLERSLTEKGLLTVYRDTVIKQVETDPAKGLITGIVAIRRVPKPGVEAAGYDRFLSQDLADWYSPEPSARFDKTTLRFTSKPGRSTVFMDATEWGEVLVLAGAPYLQGVETKDGGLEGDDQNGQATVFDFVERIHDSPVDEPAGPKSDDTFGWDEFTGKPDAWDKVWTYRRIKSVQKDGAPAVGDLCLQNWGYSAKLGKGGNDYPFGYLFLSRAETEAQRADWRGGINVSEMAAAEKRALGWHDWFKTHAPEKFSGGRITLDREVLGTSHGLAKMPYIRDTRRSVGLDGFLLKGSDLAGSAAKRKTGTRFPDRIALGAYASDVHPVTTKKMPAYVVSAHETLPFFIPFRALTNDKYGNLLVAGKTMAQSFLANAATRLHPIEWSTGTAAGVVAADMVRNGRATRDELAKIEEIQALVRAKTPIDWTIEGKVYPGEGAEVER